MRTVESEGATFSTCLSTCCMGLHEPTISSNIEELSISSRSTRFSFWSRSSVVFWSSMPVAVVYQRMILPNSSYSVTPSHRGLSDQVPTPSEVVLNIVKPTFVLRALVSGIPTTVWQLAVVPESLASVCSPVRRSCGFCYLGIRLRPLSRNLVVEVEIGCCGTGNYSHTTAEGEVLEFPLNKHQHPALKLDDVHQVNERPNEPRRQPGELESKCIRNRSGASNHGKVSLVEVFEGWQLLSRFDSF